MSSAQSDGLHVGIQLNPTLSWFSTGDVVVAGDGSTFGMQLAAVVEYGLSDRLLLSSGLRFNIGYGGNILYNRGGTFWPKSDLSDEQFRNIPAGTSVTYGIQFVEIPIGLVYLTNELGAGQTRAYIESPSLSLILSTRARAEALLDGVPTQNVLDDVRFLNFGLGFGAGIIPDWIEGASTRIGLSYQTIFTDLLNDGTFEDGSVEESKAKLGLLSFKFVLML